MNVTFRQLRLFLALAQTGSVSAAARAMHVSQPTASLQLKELTDAVGAPLYEVVSRRVRLTALGEDLAFTAQRIREEWDGFRQLVDAERGLERGRISISVVSTAKYFTPRWLGSFCRQHPGVDVALMVLNRDGVVQRLRANLDDLYIMSTPPTDLVLEDQVFLPNPLVLIAPSDHALAGKQRLPWARVCKERFILREQGSGTRMACEAYFRAKGLVPQVRLELGSSEAIKQAVRGGLGLSILSVHSLGPHFDQEGLTILDAVDFPIDSHWHLVRPKGRRLSPLAAEFGAHILREAEREAPTLLDIPPQHSASRRKASNRGRKIPAIRRADQGAG